MKTVLVIPIYNEGAHVRPLIEESKKYVDEIIAVDDGSSDNTYEEVQKTGVTVLKHTINLGKGGAMKTGADAAIKHHADIIIFMDSDGQHPPKYLPQFIDPIKKGEVDVVIGYRSMREMPLIRRMGNSLLGFLLKVLFMTKIKDIQIGYRSFAVKHYDKLSWNSKRYYADAEMSVRTGKYHLKYTQVPIETIYHDSFKGMSVIDGLKVLIQLFSWRINL